MNVITTSRCPYLPCPPAGGPNPPGGAGLCLSGPIVTPGYIVSRLFRPSERQAVAARAITSETGAAGRPKQREKRS
jgi:hypothetical protein